MLSETTMAPVRAEGAKAGGQRTALSVWSAAPTPLTKCGAVDVVSVRRSLEHQAAIGCDAVMLGGTCGEGPWLRQSDLEVLVRTGVECAAGSLQVVVQATDNSPGLILERLDRLAAWGVTCGVVAQPYFFMNATPARLRDFYLEIWDRSPLPIVFYDRGCHAPVPVPLEILSDVVGHPRVVGVKDSAGDAARFAVMSAVRRQRPELAIRTGDEFMLMKALRAGYDGAFFGGMVVTGRAVRRVLDLFASGELEAAETLDEEIKRLLFDMYGGPKITCWLSGLKYLLVSLEVFSEWTNIPGYPLTEECRRAVDQAVRDVGWLQPEG